MKRVLFKWLTLPAQGKYDLVGLYVEYSRPLAPLALALHI